MNKFRIYVLSMLALISLAIGLLSANSRSCHPIYGTLHSSHVCTGILSEDLKVMYGNSKYDVKDIHTGEKISVYWEHDGKYFGTTSIENILIPFWVSKNNVTIE
jgi:hypothetical protein